MATFSVGTVVWLKSGSPKMTVAYVDGKGKPTCSFFDGNKRCSETFYAEELTD